MDLKTALNKLKTGGPKASLPFFFCEADAKGKPVVLVGPITPDQKKKALAGAKIPKTATGKMSISDDGDLCLKAKGTALTKLAKGVTTAAMNAGARGVFKVATLAEPDPGEDEEVEGEASEESSSAGEKPSIPYSTFVPDLKVDKEVDEAPEGESSEESPNAGDQSRAHYSTFVPGRSEDEDDEDEDGEVSDDEDDEVSDDEDEGVSDDEEEATEVKPFKIRPSTGPAKKFPDALRQSPAMAKLLDQRELLRAKLEEAASKPGANPELLEKAAKKLEEMEAQLEAAQKKLNASGVAPQQMRAEYADEDKKVGWNAGAKPEPPVIDPDWSEDKKKEVQALYEKRVKFWEGVRDSDVAVRKNFSEAEKDASALSVDEKGRMVDAQGNLVTTGGSDEYVVDPETGKMHKFVASVTPTGQKKPLPDGRMVDQKERVHHSSVLSGKEVSGAGGLEVDRGEITEINNVSGHYKPGASQMIQTVEALVKQGALLNQAWVGKDGKPLEGKAAELHKKTMALQKQVAAKLKANPELDVTAQRANLDKALGLLAKLGAGPANKIKGAKVGLLDIKEGMTGLDVKNAIDSVKRDAIPAEEFLRTGGGNKAQAGKKKTMLDEIKEKGAATRARLDKDNTLSSEGSAGPGDEELDEATDALKKSKADLKRGNRQGEGEEEPSGESESSEGGSGKASYSDFTPSEGGPLRESESSEGEGEGGSSKGNYSSPLSGADTYTAYKPDPNAMSSKDEDPLRGSDKEEPSRESESSEGGGARGGYDPLSSTDNYSAYKPDPDAMFGEEGGKPKKDTYDEIDLREKEAEEKPS